MNIRTMSEDCIEDVRDIDAQCFSRTQKRSSANIRALYEHNSAGSFIVEVDNAIIGYFFTHILGKAGFVGPLGVLKKYRNSGIAKAGILKAINYLKSQGCNTIGLETLPEWCNNVGLYYKMGFQMTYPSIEGTLKGIEDFKCENIVDGSLIHRKQVVGFDNDFSIHHNGYSVLKDVEYILSNTPKQIVFYSDKDIIKGFLAFNKDIYPFIWGVVYPQFSFDIFQNLYGYIKNHTKQENCTFRINGRYSVIDSLISSGMIVARTTVRMLLKGYEGEFNMKENKSAIMRAWVG